MAAISIINNGEAMSSVRSKLNNVITEVNLLDPTDWIDYSATSTIVGWSSFITKSIRYRVIGKMVFVYFVLNGTSNNTSTTFTLPFNSVNTQGLNIIYAINNGTFVTQTSFAYTTLNSNVLTLSQNNQIWTSSGSKQAWGQLFYEIA